uniref:Alkaline ceramidase n=1 Tax=Aplanochytrium stocchinoi TaxID=215587 RepID=A0A6S8DIS1_9STRA|mmetsp:Transcript_4459/g.5621  ORF Transcript_4459/g.5621 Transcript_4459/m.5621 type:complete len:283 (-) Transcript_4459:1478-2326(-)
MDSKEETVGVMEALLLGVEKADEDDRLVEKRYWGKATGINWCERDYEHSEYIAEFWNTITNVGFIIVGVYGLFLVNKLKLPRRFTALSYCLIGLGLTSGFFHASLLWTGQKLDESFENVLLVILYHSDSMDQRIASLHSIIVTLGIFLITAFLFCEIHLIVIAILTLTKVRREAALAQLQVGEKLRLGLSRSIKIAGVSIVIGAICWLFDRLFCGVIRASPFNPQLHSWWHIFCAISLHQALVLAIAMYQFREKLEGKKTDDFDSILPLVVVNRFGLGDVKY